MLVAVLGFFHGLFLPLRALKQLEHVLWMNGRWNAFLLMRPFPGDASGCKASLLPISLSRHNHPLQRSHSAHTGGLVIFRQRLMMSAKRWSRSLLLCFPRRSFNGVAAEMFFIATWPPQLCAQGCVRATWLSCIGFASNGVSLKSSECCCRRSPAMMQAIDRFTDARPNHS